MRIKKYKIIYDHQGNVQDYLDKGWELYGYPFHGVNNSGENYTAQAVVMTDIQCEVRAMTETKEYLR